MANTLTGLIPTIRTSLDTVSRELVGMIPAVWRNPTGKATERAAKDQTISFGVTPAVALEDITPGQLPADSGSQVITAATMTIDKSKAAPILWNGEEQLSLANGDMPQYNSILGDQFEQAFRTLTNAVETDLVALYVAASESAGTAATVPFTTVGDLSDFADALKIMNQNGAPSGDLHMVLGNASIANARSLQSVLFKVNESGSENTLRNGALGRVQSFMVGESNQIVGHTAGGGSSYTSAATGYAIGITDIPIITGTGTVLAGDTITFANDATQYVVTTGVAAPGTITIAEPGLRQALPASAVALTIVATSAEQNLFFDRRAIVLASRMPALPAGGDAAEDRTTIVDPFSGLAFEVAVYRQYRQVKYEVSLAWGVSAVKPAHLGILLS